MVALVVQEEVLLLTLIALIQPLVQELWDKVMMEVELQIVAMILEIQAVVEALGGPKVVVNFLIINVFFQLGFYLLLNLQTN